MSLFRLPQQRLPFLLSLQVLHGLDTPVAGAAACELSREQLRRGLPSAAWQLLTPCLPAALRADPAAVDAAAEVVFGQSDVSIAVSLVVDGVWLLLCTALKWGGAGIGPGS